MPTALITGASSGIGADLAREFAAAGFTVTLLARRRDRLQALADELGGCRVLVADLSEPGAAGRVFAETGPVDLLVNNAGFGEYVGFADQDPANQADMIAVNMTVVAELCRVYLPAMLERRAGRILNVASIVAFMPCPGLALYAASKAFVLSLSEALFSECEGHGVTVTCLCPGATETEFAELAGMRGKLALRVPMTSREVAKLGAAATLAGKRLVVAGGRNQAASLLPRILPRGWLLRGTRKLLGGG